MSKLPRFFDGFKFTHYKDAEKNFEVMGDSIFSVTQRLVEKLTPIVEGRLSSHDLAVIGGICFITKRYHMLDGMLQYYSIVMVENEIVSSTKKEEETA